jgi:hypothetical protein
MRLQPNRNEVVLRVHDKDVLAPVQDESAGGLAVLCDPQFELQVGQKVHLCTLAGWSEAKVIRLALAPKGVLVGLERGPETPEARPEKSGLSTWALVAAAFVGLLAIPAVGLWWSSVKSPLPEAAKATRAATLELRPASGPAPAP